MEKDLFRIIFENFKDGFLFTDRLGKILYANRAYYELCGLPEECLNNRYSVEAAETEPNFLGGEVVAHVLAHEERIEMLLNPENLERMHHVTGLPLFGKDGEMEYICLGLFSPGNIRNLNDYLTDAGRRSIRENIKTANLMTVEDGADAVIAKSESMKNAVAMALQVAPTDVSVLLTGASGAGKEVLADLIYQNSRRKGQPFIKINCSAIPANLLESELFGYAEGAFTGAMKGGKPGLFEVANGGVVFLDEIGDMPLELQPKILRLLQTREVTRVGGRDVIPLDIRLISATNKNLAAAIVNKEFREDLYYRINIVPINLRPLRERKEDIEPLIKHFLKKFNERYEKKVVITAVATDMMKGYEWPGNIRELKNIVERMIVMSTSGIIDAETVSIFLGVEKLDEPEGAKTTSLYTELEKLEKQLITSALKQNRSKRKAAEELGIDHSTLLKKLKKYGL